MSKKYNEVSLKNGKKYIDRMGNISVASPLTNFYDVVIPNKTRITHIDNIFYVKKETIGRTEFDFITETGKIDTNVKTSPYNIISEFTLRMKIKLFIKRFVFNIIPDNIKYGFISSEFDDDYFSRKSKIKLFIS